MKLDDVRPGIEALLTMERYVDEATQTYSRFAAQSEVAPQFRPRSECPSFEAITVRAPRERVSLFEADPDPALRARYVSDDEVRFVVHPETWASPDLDRRSELLALPLGEPIRVAPTASTRTVLALDDGPLFPRHFLKLHYPRRISRFNRRLRLVNIRNSVLATRDVAELRSDRFAVLPDVLGVTYDGARGAGGPEPWGFLVREARPRPHVPRSEQRVLVPYFALYGGDLHHPDDPPLLVQMIERLGVEPEGFVVEEIMIPVLECWAKAARERGILLESHAQNVLLEVDERFRPRRVVHRDLDVWFDRRVRERAGLSLPFDGAWIGRDTPYPHAPHYSLVYDRFVGRELFDYLLAILTRHFAADGARVRERVKAAFHHAFPAAADFFPKRTMFYFGDELLPDNEFALVDMQREPDWR
jgi:hypothetical protein